MLTQSEKQQLRQMGLNKPNWEENNKRNVLFGLTVLALLATSGAGAPAAIYIMECIGWSWTPLFLPFFNPSLYPRKRKFFGIIQIAWFSSNLTVDQYYQH